MNRRKFLQNFLCSGALVGSGLGASLAFTNASANTVGAITQRILVNLMLNGGADFRFLFVPEPGSDYADKFWEARKSLYRDNADNIARYSTYDDVWSDLYVPVVNNGITFGIHKNAGWLIAQFNTGNVAIVSNVVTSGNRRHDHSQLIVRAGATDAGQYQAGRDGWGGRLAYVIGNANVIPVSTSVSLFCNGIDPDNRLEKVVHSKNIRSFSLPNGDGDPVSTQSVLASALRDYYEQRGAQIEEDILAGRLSSTWPFRRFFNRESVLRDFGGQLSTRFAADGRPQPMNDLVSGPSSLSSSNFALQCANLFDCYLAQDLLQMRVAYMDYGIWDTHNNQQVELVGKLSDVFGANGGLSVLTQELGSIPGASENTIFVITTDFGRQLAANGGLGTDHGNGNYMILIGPGVQGGTYGEMFPQKEILATAGNVAPFDRLGADIEGRTSFEHVLSASCDWAQPGAGPVVFPKAGGLDLESGVSPDQFFTA